MHFVFTPQPNKLLNYCAENQTTVFNNVQDLGGTISIYQIYRLTATVNCWLMRFRKMHWVLLWQHGWLLQITDYSYSELLTFALQKNALGIILAAWMASRSQLPQIITILSLEKAHGRYGRSSPESSPSSSFPQVQVVLLHAFSIMRATNTMSTKRKTYCDVLLTKEGLNVS